MMMEAQKKKEGLTKERVRLDFKVWILRRDRHEDDTQKKKTEPKRELDLRVYIQEVFRFMFVEL